MLTVSNLQAFLDWGLHTDDVTLQRPKPPPPGHPGPYSQVATSVRDPHSLNPDPAPESGSGSKLFLNTSWN